LTRDVATTFDPGTSPGRRHRCSTGHTNGARLGLREYAEREEDMAQTVGQTSGAAGSPAPVGSVGSLWRYPVKSMAGEELDASAITERGLRGDRAYALVDRADGKVASAKNPRKWPRLFEFAAAYAEDPTAAGALPAVRITVPDGTALSSDQHDLSQALSRALDRQVRFQAAERGQHEVVDPTSPWAPRAEEYWPDIEGLDFRDTVTDFDLPEGTFFDAAVVHLVSTATMGRLHELYPQGQMATRRFRPNIVVATPEGVPGFVENDWVGRTLHIGDDVQLSVTGPCPRCVMITLPQGELPKDTGILRTAARHNRANVGVYASVRCGGQVRVGDPITLQ